MDESDVRDRIHQILEGKVAMGGGSSKQWGKCIKRYGSSKKAKRHYSSKTGRCAVIKRRKTTGSKTLRKKVIRRKRSTGSGDPENDYGGVMIGGYGDEDMIIDRLYGEGRGDGRAWKKCVKNYGVRNASKHWNKKTGYCRGLKPRRSSGSKTANPKKRSKYNSFVKKFAKQHEGEYSSGKDLIIDAATAWNLIKCGKPICPGGKKGKKKVIIVPPVPARPSLSNNLFTNGSTSASGMYY